MLTVSGLSILSTCIKCFGKIYEQHGYLEILITYCYYDPIACLDRWSWGPISPKAVLILYQKCIQFWTDTINKQDVINVSSYNSKSHPPPVVHSDSNVTLLKIRKMMLFIHFLNCVLCVHNITLWKKQGGKFSCLHIFGGILSSPAAFLCKEYIYPRYTFKFDMKSNLNYFLVCLSGISEGFLCRFLKFSYFLVLSFYIFYQSNFCL